MICEYIHWKARLFLCIESILQSIWFYEDNSSDKNRVVIKFLLVPSRRSADAKRGRAHWVIIFQPSNIGKVNKFQVIRNIIPIEKKTGFSVNVLADQNLQFFGTFICMNLSTLFSCITFRNKKLQDWFWSLWKEDKKLSM